MVRKSTVHLMLFRIAVWKTRSPKMSAKFSKPTNSGSGATPFQSVNAVTTVKMPGINTIENDSSNAGTSSR